MYVDLTTSAASSGYDVPACCVVVPDASEGWRLKNLSLCLKKNQICDPYRTSVQKTL